MTAEQVIELLGMKPVPEEGGYYVETYRCKEKLTQPPCRQDVPAKGAFALPFFIF